jgi:hypothetical protein
VTFFELEAVGGPWARRLARRRAAFEALPWGESPGTGSDREAGQWVWTQSAFSEYASAAAFAEIAACLLSAGAPIDLVAAAGDFVVDEVIHAEMSARVAMSLGGAVALDVDLTRLVRPPQAEAPLLRAAELLVRTSCVGEVLTLPILKTAKALSRSPLVKGVLARIARDESSHAQLGWWFLDWAADRLSAGDRDHLGRVAGGALRAFAPVFPGTCTPAVNDGGSARRSAELRPQTPADLGVLDCASYDAAFGDAVAHRVVAPLGARGIVVPADDLVAVPR